MIHGTVIRVGTTAPGRDGSQPVTKTDCQSDVRHLLNKYCRPPAVRLSSSTSLVAATLRPIIMFRFMHGSTRDCDGVSRREFYRVGGSGWRA